MTSDRAERMKYMAAALFAALAPYGAETFFKKIAQGWIKPQSPSVFLLSAGQETTGLVLKGIGS
ncbi:MAG: hypothetical protein P1U62_00360 [Alteraurantiacibacter sp. bin_em_oilr2.035]|nr:hypothetical protein [Alteraurantiacibacter sp. bin_em_oilr2.035]